MKILLDENLTPKSKNILGKYGHDVIHVRDRFIAGKSDEEVFELAQKEERILITLNGKDFIIFIPPVTLKEHYGFIWLRKLHVTNLTYIPIMDKIGMFLSDENTPTKNTYYVVKKRDNEYEIIQQYPKIQFDKYDDSTYKQLQLISQDKQKRLEYEAREKAIRDYNQMMFEAEERGIELGVERINKLNTILLQNKRYADLERATNDKNFQQRLMSEYGI